MDSSRFSTEVMSRGVIEAVYAIRATGNTCRLHALTSEAELTVTISDEETRNVLCVVQFWREGDPVDAPDYALDLRVPSGAA